MAIWDAQDPCCNNFEAFSREMRLFSCEQGDQNLVKALPRVMLSLWICHQVSEWQRPSGCLPWGFCQRQSKMSLFLKSCPQTSTSLWISLAGSTHAAIRDNRPDSCQNNSYVPSGDMLRNCLIKGDLLVRLGAALQTDSKNHTPYSQLSHAKPFHSC